VRRAVVAALLLAAAPLRAEEPLPARHEALLLLRVLAYDRSLRRRDDRQVTVALAVRPGDAAGEAQAEALAGSVRQASLEFTVGGLPLRALLVPAERGSLAARLREVRASVVVPVGVAAAEPILVCQGAREAQVLSAARTRAAVETCVAVALVAEGGRARVLVNLAAAHAEGADLDSALLSMARLVAGAER